MNQNSIVVDVSKRKHMKVIYSLDNTETKTMCDNTEEAVYEELAVIKAIDGTGYIEYLLNSYKEVVRMIYNKIRSR